MSQAKSGSLPSIFVPEGEKDEKYHRDFVQGIASKSIYSGYADRRAIMDECLNFYLGLQGGEEFDFLQKAEDGEVLPAKWMDFNKIAVKIDLLVGELSQRSYKINVKANNKDAQSRRLDEKDRLLTEMRFEPIASMLEEENGIPLQSDETFIPQNKKELDVYMDKGYKEKSEIVMRALMSFLRKHGNWEYERIAAFRDLLIMGLAFFENVVIDGIPRLQRSDPREMIFDVNSKDDFLSDSTYWGKVCYMSLSEITKRFKLTKKELEEAFKDYNDWSSQTNRFNSFTTDFGFIDRGSRMRIFKNEGGEMRVLVVKAYWQDFKSINYEDGEDKYGQDHIKLKGENSTSEKNKKKLIQIWRQGTLIGGRFMKDFGIMKNQDRSVDNIATTTPPFVGLIPNFLNGAIVSKVHRLKPLQNLKNIAMYRVMLDIARSGGKGFIYDISQLPKGWDIHTALKYLRTTGISYVDSSVEGAGAYNQFKEIDMGLSQSVNQFLELSMFLDREMDSISGVNEARQGLVQGASQAVGVTNSALAQSNLSTVMYTTLFSQMFTKAMNKQAGLAKIAWAGKERFASIIGDVGINFLEEDIELDLNDYNVFIEEVPPALADQQMFYQLVMAGIQAGQLPFVFGMKLLLEKDIDEAVQMLELESKRQEEKQEEQAIQEQEMQQQQMQQQEQAQQMQDRGAQAAAESKVQAQEMKSQADIQKILAQGRLDLRQGAMGFKQSLAMKKIDAAIQAQKNKEKSKSKPK